MFEEIFTGIEGLKREQAVMKLTVPDLDMDDPLFSYKPASDSFKKLAVPLLRSELAAELFGQPDVTFAKVPIHTPSNTMNKFFKSGMEALCCLCGTQFPSKAEMDEHFATCEEAV